MNSEEEKISQEAINFVKKNANFLINEFIKDPLVSIDNPSSVFMAGSPGAGKTEFSRRLIEKFKQDNIASVIMIDPDEIRNIIPGYDGSNSYLFQAAVSVGVDKLHDHVLKYNKNFILDGTLSNYEKSLNNIRRSLDRGRPTVIYYLYQEPLLAWDFTRKREALEGRRITKEIFIDNFFAAMYNVNRIKAELGNKIELDLVIKNYENDTEDTKLNIDKIDNYIKSSHTKKDLIKLLT